MPSDSGSKVRLFVYGLLGPDYDMPKEAEDLKHDSIRGCLYDLKKDAAMVDVGSRSSPWSRGVSYLIPRSVLAKIDRSELPEYRRVETTTWSGDKVWVYEYDRDLPPKAPEIKSWKLNEKYRGLKSWLRRTPGAGD